MEFVRTFDNEVQVYAQNIIMDFYKADSKNDYESMVEISKGLDVKLSDLQNVVKYVDLLIEHPDFDAMVDSWLKVMDAIENKAYNV